MIAVTEHICERYIERFNTQLAAIDNHNRRINAAEKAIRAILKDAEYISNNDDGVLLRSETFQAYMVVNKGMLITIYPVDRKIKHREQKHKSSGSNQ